MCGVLSSSALATVSLSLSPNGGVVGSAPSTRMSATSSSSTLSAALSRRLSPIFRVTTTGGAASSSSVAHTASAMSAALLSTAGGTDWVGRVRTVEGGGDEEGGGRVVSEERGGRTAGDVGAASNCSLCSSFGFFSSSMGGAGKVMIRFAASDDVIGSGDGERCGQRRR